MDVRSSVFAVSFFFSMEMQYSTCNCHCSFGISAVSQQGVCLSFRSKSIVCQYGCMCKGRGSHRICKNKDMRVLIGSFWIGAGLLHFVQPASRSCSCFTCMLQPTGSASLCFMDKQNKLTYKYLCDRCPLF